MSADKTNVKRTVGMYSSFDRSGAATRMTHYCPGCGHGILHKLIAEALVEMGLQDRTVMVSPIGCAVFGYYYWDIGNIGAAHGRAPAIATAIARTRPDSIVLAYQGDGDFAAIGFNCAFQAASRGEHMATFLVNNTNYGMTGGQLSPTSLIGQETTTSPLGRSAETEGYPIHVCEVFNQLPAPVYIARCSVADTPRIMQAKKAIRKAIEIQRDGRGYALVEFLAPCPFITGGDSQASTRFTIDKMEKEFPLGVFRDTPAGDVAARVSAKPCDTLHSLFHSDEDEVPQPQFDASVKERRMVFAGSGGQGILSLGLCINNAGTTAKRYTTWFPTYGPEQRGGSASCSLVIAGHSIGAPNVDKTDVLVCMTRPMLERFLSSAKPGSLVFVDSIILDEQSPRRDDVRFIAIPASEIASAAGFTRAANTAILAAMAYTDATGLPLEAIVHARDAAMRKKPDLQKKNQAVFDSAMAWCKANI